MSSLWIKQMLFPVQKPEITKLSHLSWIYCALVLSQVIFVYSVYVVYFQLFHKPFIFVFTGVYGIITVYCLGYLMDNSPLLSVSSILVCGVILQALHIPIWNRYTTFTSILFLYASGYIKDQYSHALFNKKPVLVNMMLYPMLGFFPIVMIFQVYNQNKYYNDALIGMRMVWFIWLTEATFSQIMDPCTRQ